MCIGTSGYCDCNGDGNWSKGEPRFNCDCPGVEVCENSELMPNGSCADGESPNFKIVPKGKTPAEINDDVYCMESLRKDTSYLYLECGYTKWDASRCMSRTCNHWCGDRKPQTKTITNTTTTSTTKTSTTTITTTTTTTTTPTSTTTSITTTISSTTTSTPTITP